MSDATKSEVQEAASQCVIWALSKGPNPKTPKDTIRYIGAGPRPASPKLTTNVTDAVVKVVGISGIDRRYETVIIQIRDVLRAEASPTRDPKYTKALSTVFAGILRPDVRLGLARQQLIDEGDQRLFEEPTVYLLAELLKYRKKIYGQPHGLANGAHKAH